VVQSWCGSWCGLGAVVVRIFTKFGAKAAPQRSNFVINLPSFYGLVAFVKTVVSCTRNTNFEGLEGHLGAEILGTFLQDVLRRLSGQACCRNSPKPPLNKS